MTQTPTPSSRPAEWYPDPTLRHEQRYWDGTTWTEHVSDAIGEQSTDPLTGPPLPEGARERRRRVIASLANRSNYRKPLREGGSISDINLLGGSWNEYAEVVLSALMVETLLDIDARLEYLTEVIVQREDSPAQ